MKFLEVIQNRRSIYAIGKNIPVSREEIEQTIQMSIRHTPSAFNIQSTKAVVLFGKEHDAFWDMLMEELRPVVPAENFDSTEKKILSFKAAYGTVLYFDDTDLTTSLEERFPLYAKNFKPWAEQANGIAQFAVWAALSEIGVGASLQHYSELIEARAKEKWELPTSWRMIAQMPFGSIEAKADVKEFDDINQRVKIFG